jgi:O-antigen/teichoic acid export membrane protein
MGKERIRIYNFLLFFQPAISFVTLLTCIFIFKINDIRAPLISLYVSFGCMILLSAFAVYKSAESCENEGILSWRSIFRNGLINQLGNLAHILSNRYNYYVISALSLSLVGVYASATSLIESVLIISASVSPLILTHIANGRDIPNNARFTLLMAKLCFLLSLCCVVILFFIPASFFTGLLGKDFSQTKHVMLYLSPGVLALSFSSVISHYFSGLGEQKTLLTANACGLLITLASSYFMVQRFGLKGACITASAAYFVQAILLSIYFFRKNSGLSLRNFIMLKKDLDLLQRND